MQSHQQNARELWIAVRKMMSNKINTFQENLYHYFTTHTNNCNYSFWLNKINVSNDKKPYFIGNLHLKSIEFINSTSPYFPDIFPKWEFSRVFSQFSFPIFIFRENMHCISPMIFDLELNRHRQLPEALAKKRELAKSNPCAGLTQGTM